ncbi:ABC transporter ATP-binding protein [Paracoccus marinaquae]|uniref:ABC transporter ATP-binding protein n=1 Tax=Paracoccus marinaquae TaxID=2841926 RepID=A0ABS6AK50_9RHOB|nr:ABC transporter ATP-binding protein [Paracoccus marinaquae]MBU3030492.1 ABC transporter ATP-binding protein [Paracoccus marinaquae]
MADPQHRDLTKTFTIDGEALTVLKNINLDIRAGESLAIVGASGSGKTTLLRVLAGLEEPDDGGGFIDGAPVLGLARERAVIFQVPRLLPWLRVLGNVAFGLELRGVPRAEAEARSRHYLDLVGLGCFEAAWPWQLSGGMAQRVGIARALTMQPEILLLDEPFGTLDAMTRITMQDELVRIWTEEAVTMVLVTHDLEEAIFLADRVLVLPRSKGGVFRLIKVDLPRPRDRNDAEFVRHRRQLMAEFGLH